MSSSIQYALDAANNVWRITANVDGSVQTTQMPAGFVPGTVGQYLVDSTGQAWTLAVATDGSLQTGQVSNPGLSQPSNYLPATTAASSILTSVKADITGGVTNSAVLLDYVDRIQKRMLRESQWAFMKSGVQRFLTQPGSHSYWLGQGLPPAGSINTNLGLTDVYSLWTESVFDRSNNRQLFPVLRGPQGTDLYADGTPRPGRPRMFENTVTNPYLVNLFPNPDNGNGYQPIPQTPVCSTTLDGPNASRTYFVATTLVDDAGNESTASPLPAVIFAPAGMALAVIPPPAPQQSASGVGYSRYNLYVGTTPYGMTKQNAQPMTGAFIEPVTGLIAGSNAPTHNTLTPLYGYVIEFIYFRQRSTISQPTDILMIPDVYRDVVIAGVNSLVNLYLSRPEDRDKAQFWKGEFNDGLRQMRRDLNLSFRNTNFIAPDPAYSSSRSGISYSGFDSLA